MDRAAALKAIRNGVIAACIGGTLALGAVIFLMRMAANETRVLDERLAYFNDPFIFFDVFLIFTAAFFLHRKSRAAAIFLFCYLIISKIMLALEFGKMSGMGPNLIFLYFYGKAIQGTFAYHKLEQQENPNYKPSSRWKLYIGIPIGLVFLILIGLGISSQIGIFPPTNVVSGKRLYESQRNDLITNNIITKDETIEYFYSEGAFSILEGGSVLTDHRVIIYFQDENEERQVYSIYFDEITAVDLQVKGNWSDDSLYKVSTHDPENWLVLELSTESDGDRRFVDALKTKIANSSTAPF
jgi:hypothetical protein